MDINTYLHKYTKNGGNLEEFARKAGMTRVYLTHIRRGRKNPGMKKVVGLIEASGGAISISSLHPELFPAGDIGDLRMRLIQKSAKPNKESRPRHKPEIL